jgi:lipopolysaccharide/colanic/teichoic acid biosynthesis glycosyltransferase
MPLSTSQCLQDFARRLLDVTVALPALIVLSPVLLVIALAVVFDSPGNPFYLARRIGRLGRPFIMVKFRTMVRDASAAGPAITGNRDPRITRVGAFLRRTKLDELPQFINVLIGHMSLVGPRPEAPALVALYTPDERRVLHVRPGLTGAVQLLGDESELIPPGVDVDKYYAEYLMHAKLRLDLRYLETRTLLSDLTILLSTAVFVIRSFTRT